MPSRIDLPAVRLSIRVYLRLVITYPTNHREIFGSDMVQVFRDQCRAVGIGAVAGVVRWLAWSGGWRGPVADPAPPPSGHQPLSPRRFCLA